MFKASARFLRPSAGASPATLLAVVFGWVSESWRSVRLSARGSAGGERNVLCSLACPGSTESGLSAFLCKRFLAVKHASSPRRRAGKSARVALTPNFLKPLILVSWSWSWSCISTSSLADTSVVEGPSESIMLFRAILPDRAVGRVLLRVCCWRLRAVASSDVFFERELWSMKGVTRGAVVVSVR
jgi:hypothetical protein